MTEGAYIPQDAQSANSVVESWSKGQERIDRLKEEEANQKVEQQKVELQKQEVQIQQQQQDTYQILVVGGLGIGVVLTIVLAIFLLAKIFRSKNK